MEDVPGDLEAVEVHHRVQASLVELLEQLLRRGHERALTEETIARLVDFTLAHFKTEERLMKQYAYPDAEAHAAEHVRLMEAVRRIQAAHASGGEGGSEQLAELRPWLLEHIQRTDGPFLTWCTTRGLQGGEGG